MMESKKVLIVEDEKIVALDIKNQLQKSGYTVCGIYGSGEKAIEDIGVNEPDIVLMDIQLQGKIDGVETAGIIRKDYLIPVIFLTAYADDKTVERAKFIEPFGYITKPFDERALKTTIEMALYKSKMDHKLLVSEEKYRRLFEDDLSGNFICSPQGVIEECNSAFLQMFQFEEKKDVYRYNLNDLFPDEESKKAFWNRLMRDRQIQLMELSFHTVKGTEITVLANVIGSFSGDSLKEMKGYLIDVTKKKKLEVQLRHAQKMEAVGRLAGGVAHDFNNILTVINGYSSIMKDKFKAGEDIIPDLDNLKGSIKRAVRLTKQLLLFSRSEVLKPQVLDLNQCIQNLEKLLHRLIPENISLQLFLDGTQPFVFIDPGQIEQVIINLIVNARDAIGNAGMIIIQTENVAIDSETMTANGILLPGDYIRLSVSDNGSGIEQVHLSKVFEPFFTTKNSEEGTGLGLATVYGIVDQSGGYIQVESAKGRGSRFVIYLPRKGEQDGTAESATVPDDETRGTETILVVEDDENVRRITGSMLRRKGYTVLEAKNGGEAILIVEKEVGAIDLLLTDYTLPFINGDELASRLLEILPGLKVIFMTGNPQITKPLAEFANETSVFIHKPFEISELYRLIREMFDL